MMEVSIKLYKELTLSWIALSLIIACLFDCGVANFIAIPGLFLTIILEPKRREDK